MTDSVVPADTATGSHGLVDQILHLGRLARDAEAEVVNLRAALKDHDSVRAEISSKQEARRIAEWQVSSAEIRRLRAELAAAQARLAAVEALVNERPPAFDLGTSSASFYSAYQYCSRQWIRAVRAALGDPS